LSTPRPTSWIVVAHVGGAALIGGLDAARLGSLGIVLPALAVFAATGLLIGGVVAGAERAVEGRPWWHAALGLAAPSLVIAVPVARSLFQGAYAQTLPLASVAPYVLPLVIWLGVAAAVAAGRRLVAGGDKPSRALAVLALAGAIGGIVWVERNVLRTGYPTAHLGATLAVVVLAGCAVRVAYRGAMPRVVALGVSAFVVLAATVAALAGLTDPTDRRRLATFGDQSRDLIGLWRSVLDFDRDGASRVLGGGDCDDLDASRYPGAVDIPGDGIDQDCDGVDAVAVVVEPEPAAADLATWRASPEVTALLARTRDMNILLVTVDALRADVLAPGAPHRDDFPTLTGLLDESVWFTRAFAPGAGTDISIATLLTGRHQPFQPVEHTLVEALRASGRRTHAAIPAEVLRYAGEALIARGLDKLTRVYTDRGQRDVGDHVSAGTTTRDGLRALAAAGDRSWLIWLHYFDVHEHHQIAVPAELLAEVHDGGSIKAHRYRALLKAIDRELARVLAALAERGLAERTIVVFASDHGESLGDDPRLPDTHGKVIYAALSRVPIALRIPGVAPGRRDELVSLVDLAPTLLGLTGARPPELPLDGLDLLPVLLDGPAELRPHGRALALHEQDQWSVVEWPHQLLVRPADNLVELYDLDRDPAQRDELSERQPELVSRLKARYAAFPAVTIDRTPAGRSARERLARQRPSRAP
jgi:choline-sulfatase